MACGCVNSLTLYISDPSPPKVRLLDDVTKLILGGVSQKEGIGLTDFGILIIETDGTISKNDTLKSSYNGADRYENDLVRTITIDSPKLTASDEFAEFHALQKPSSKQCATCPRAGKFVEAVCLYIVGATNQVTLIRRFTAATS